MWGRQPGGRKLGLRCTAIHGYGPRRQCVRLRHSRRRGHGRRQLASSGSGGASIKMQVPSEVQPSKVQECNKSINAKNCNSNASMRAMRGGTMVPSGTIDNTCSICGWTLGPTCMWVRARIPCLPRRQATNTTGCGNEQKVTSSWRILSRSGCEVATAFTAATMRPCDIAHSAA